MINQKTYFAYYGNYMVDEPSKLIVKWIGAFLVDFGSMTMLLNIYSGDF